MGKEVLSLSTALLSSPSSIRDKVGLFPESTTQLFSYQITGSLPASSEERTFLETTIPGYSNSRQIIKIHLHPTSHPIGEEVFRAELKKLQESLRWATSFASTPPRFIIGISPRAKHLRSLGFRIQSVPNTVSKRNHVSGKIKSLTNHIILWKILEKRRLKEVFSKHEPGLYLAWMPLEEFLKINFERS